MVNSYKIDNTIITKIHNCYYDLTKFKHPGGVIPISLADSRDATELYEVHHQFSNKEKIENILSKYKIDIGDKNVTDIKSIDAFDWDKTLNDQFVVDLKHKVQQKLNNNIKIDKIRILEAVIFYICTIFSYYLFYCGYWISLISLPISAWIFSVNIFHDASHFAISKNGRINQILTYLTPYLSSPLMWYHQHIIGHHNYTNIPHLDPDLYHNPTLIRHTKYLKFKQLHMYQKITVWLTWMIAIQGLSFINSIKLYLLGDAFKYNRIVDIIPCSRKRIIMHFIGRFINFFILHILPFFYVGFSLKGFMWTTIPMVIYSILFMICTQINHLTPESVEIKDGNYFRHQIITSNNVNTSNYFVYLFMGGLNFQIEHHLFPSVNHCHLYKIQPIIKELCNEYNINYQEYPTLWSAIKAHYDHIIEMSSE